MFRFLFYRANGVLLFNGESTATISNPLSSLNTPLFFIRRSFSGPAADNPTPTHHNSFTVSYLIDSCGLSEDKAISASEKIQLKSSGQPDSVLNLFRNHDFPNTHISKIILKLPSLLLSDPDKTLKPKLDFFNSIGIFGPDLAKLISKDPHTLKQSLENTIVPAIGFLKSVLLTESNLITVIRRAAWLLHQHPQKRLAPNIAILQTHGLSNDNILKLLVSTPATFLRTDRLIEIIEEINKMKFDPSKYGFLAAIKVLSCINKSSWEEKSNIYKRWGWSEDNIRTAFRKQPLSMMYSEKKIMGIMEFLVYKMGYDPLLFVKYPYVLSYSLEKRVIPRLSVIQVLITKGLDEKHCHINTVLKLSDKDFIKMFVTKFEEKVPELLNVNQGKMESPVSTH